MQKVGRKYKKKKPQLPPYVFEKTGRWYVRRFFKKNTPGADGKTAYIQIVRACHPMTPERAAELAAAIEAAHNSSVPLSAPQTIRDAVNEFVGAKRHAVKPRTAQYYDWMYSRYVDDKPLGLLDLDSVTPKTIQDQYALLTADKVSPTMIRKLHIFLSMAFKQAVRWEMMRRNPCEGVILPLAKDSEIEIMGEDEAKKFMAVCLDDPRLQVLAFALETWMRPGEYLGLSPKNIDLKNRTVFVDRSVAFPAGGGHYFKDPKTKASRRYIEISPAMAEVLESRMKGDLAFPGEKGGPIAPNNLGRRQMAEACKRAGIKKYSIYSLRHSGATIALTHGAHIKAVSERLGHASIQITLDVYAHVLPRMSSQVVQVLTDALY